MCFTLYNFLIYAYVFICIYNFIAMILMLYLKSYVCALIFFVFCFYFGCSFKYILSVSTGYPIIVTNDKKIFKYIYHNDIKHNANLRKKIKFMSIFIALTIYIYCIFFDNITIFTSKISKSFYFVNLTLYGTVCFWIIYDNIAHNIFECENVMLENVEYEELA